jgi:hypothetical protein
MIIIFSAMLLWALLATGFMGYYYLEYMKTRGHLDEVQGLLREIADNYNASAAKRNLLYGDYGLLLGEYQWIQGENCSLLMTKYEKLLLSLSGNYTSTLKENPDLNETYNALLNKFYSLNNKSLVTKEEFGPLLTDFYKLLTALATREMEKFIGRASVIHVNIIIDYGNQTIKWYNQTPASPGTTLFEVTRKIADIEYSYWPTMEPGHILVTSINNYTAGYWIWYYWDETKSEWVFGPVGCDAWILTDEGIYKWACIPS